MPHSVLDCCESDKHSSGLLLSQKAILDSLCEQRDLVYGRPPMSKVRLLLWEQWVNERFETGLDESLEDFKGDTQQRYRAIVLWGRNGFSGLGIAPIKALILIIGILIWCVQEAKKYFCCGVPE